MKAGTTSTGFSYELADERLGDYETFEMLTEVEAGNTSALPKALRALLGDEQHDALKAHIKELNGGRVPIEAMMAEVQDILTGPAKN